MLWWTQLIFIGILACIILGCTGHIVPSGSNTEDREKVAEEEKFNSVQKLLVAQQLDTDDFQLLFIAYKAEAELNLYAKKKTAENFKKICSYPICASSGKPGPKNKEGDLQVPEGFYHIDRFNPKSKFYLLLGLNYPNEADRKRSDAPNLGGDVFIHGACVTVGCLPMTDDTIKEIYLFALLAKRQGQTKIPVYIFPFQHGGEKENLCRQQYQNDKKLLHFWDNLMKRHQLFYEQKKALNIKIGPTGDYLYL